jgi:hypothetical protein
MLIQALLIYFLLAVGGVVFWDRRRKARTFHQTGGGDGSTPVAFRTGQIRESPVVQSRSRPTV